MAPTDYDGKHSSNGKFDRERVLAWIGWMMLGTPKRKYWQGNYKEDDGT
jgi:hypothetical protein